MLVGAEGQDDECDLESFQEHALEGDRERIPVERTLLERHGPRRLGFLGEDRLFVVHGLEPRRAENRLAQPL